MKKLTRVELKQLKGGVAAPPVGCEGSCDYQGTTWDGKKFTTPGSCRTATGGCYCSNGMGSCS